MRARRKKKQPVRIVSSDKDLMQLIRPGVEMFDPLKTIPIGPDEVMKKFGVTPDKVVDVQALAGDSTDNIPGVPGIGVKTAAELINQYGDLETLLKRAGKIKQPKRRENLIRMPRKRASRKSWWCWTIKRRCPTARQTCKRRADHRESLIAFLQKQEFRSLLARMGATGDRRRRRLPGACWTM